MLKQYAGTDVSAQQPETASILPECSTSVPAAKSVPLAVPMCDRISNAEVSYF